MIHEHKSFSTITKLWLMRALVWPVATHGCETWTLRKQEERRIQAFENKCIRKLLRIPWTKLMTTAQVYKMARTENELLNRIKSRKLWYFRHVIRQPHDNVEGSVMVGFVEGVRNRGRQRICWLDNVCQWTGLSGDNLLHSVRDRRCWTSLTHPCSQPLWSNDGAMTWHMTWHDSLSCTCTHPYCFPNFTFTFQSTGNVFILWPYLWPWSLNILNKQTGPTAIPGPLQWSIMIWLMNVWCIEHTAMMVPVSCCAKSQYGAHIDIQKCQNWPLGPPNVQTSQTKDINEALNYEVCSLSHHDIIIHSCQWLVVWNWI